MHRAANAKPLDTRFASKSSSEEQEKRRLLAVRRLRHTRRAAAPRPAWARRAPPQQQPRPLRELRLHPAAGRHRCLRACGVIGTVVVATTGSAPTGAGARRGQEKSSARPAGGRHRLALDQDARRDRRSVARWAARCHRATAGTSRPTRQRHHRAGERACRRPGWPGRCDRASCAAPDGSATGVEPGVISGADLALDIVCELARAGLGEIDAVAGAQPPDLAFKVGALRGEAAGVVDEAVPDIDVGDARPFRRAAR